MLFLFPLDVLDEIRDLIGSVSEGFPTYSCWILSVFYHPVLFFKSVRATRRNIN